MELRGEGNTLGEAIVSALRGAWSRRKPAVSWHAQLSQLTKTIRGQDILARFTNPRRWVAWLSEEVTPSADSRASIERAYRMMLGAAEVKTGKAEIRGRVAVGTDVRDRGTPPHAPLRIDHRNGHWGRFEPAWLAGVEPWELEDIYIEDVIMYDIDDFSIPPQFPPGGGAFVITITT